MRYGCSKSAIENYPVRLDAIAAVERWISFENYIIADDKIGRIFADALARRARV
jgi:cardiolipin synthase